MRPVHPAIFITLIITLALGATMITGCAQESSAVETQPTGVTVQFNVGGMHCEGCAALIRSTVSKVEGVQRCAVSYEEEAAEVVLAEDDETTIEKIIEAVVEEGFTIERRQDRAG